MKKSTLILITVIAETGLVLAQSYIFILFPYSSAEPVMLNGIIRTVIKELILLPMIILIAYEMRTRKNTYTPFMLISFLLIGAADAIITYSMIAGLGFFLIVHLSFAVNYTRRFIQSHEKITSLSASFPVVFFAAGLGTFFLLFNAPLSGDTVKWAAVLIYSIVLGYSTGFAFSLIRTRNIDFFLAVAAGALLFFFCDVQVAFSELVKLKEANVWSNSIIYHSGLYLIALSTLLNPDE